MEQERNAAEPHENSPILPTTPTPTTPPEPPQPPPLRLIKEGEDHPLNRGDDNE